MLIGNLGKDPEVKFTNSQMAVANFSLATSERRKDANGEYADVVEWHNIVVFGKTAENCQSYIRKGSKVYIEGSIKTRKWQDKEGKDRWSTEVLANTVQFLDSKPRDDSGAVRDINQKVNSRRKGDIDPNSFDQSDIPF